MSAPTLEDLLAQADAIEAEAQRQRNELISRLATLQIENDDLRQENALLRRRGLRVVNPREESA